MIIQFKGHQIEAYPLIMRKQNALDIITGRKVVEVRQYSPKYYKMFTNTEQVEINNKLMEQGREEECESVFKDIEVVHFYPYNNKWYLDVLIDEIGIFNLNREGIEYMNREYDFHDMDDAWQQFEGKPEDEIPYCYFLHISKVLQTNIT